MKAGFIELVENTTKPPFLASTGSLREESLSEIDGREERDIVSCSICDEEVPAKAAPVRQIVKRMALFIREKVKHSLSERQAERGGLTKERLGSRRHPSLLWNLPIALMS